MLRAGGVRPQDVSRSAATASTARRIGRSFYRGAQRDETLLSLLRGGTMRREQRLSYRFHSDLVGDGGPVLGVREVELDEIRVRVRDYGIPLPPREVEVFDFREPLEQGTLIVVLARPLGAQPIIEFGPTQPLDPPRLDLGDPALVDPPQASGSG